MQGVREAELNSLQSIVSRYAGLTAWVVGDLMLDEYVFGAVERISPEAPVPVVRAQASEYRLGGAANVASQLSVLGMRPILAGTIGVDQAGRDLRRLAGAAQIDLAAVVEDATRRTTRKLRVLGQSQQLLRLDWEDVGPCAADLSRQILAQLAAAPRPDVVILSDYAKGMLTPATIAAVMAAAGNEVPVLVDPKHADFSRYRGAACITPNLRELEATVGRKLDPDDAEEIAAAARATSERADIGAIVVTLGGRGMLVVARDAPPISVPAERREVYDVTGAGDTAIAVLAASLAAKASLHDAAKLANLAAGLAVGHIGAAAVDPASIRDALWQVPAGKVLARSELAAKANSWRSAGKRVVFTNGCFDLLHSGHLSLLQEAARHGDVLLVAINSDASVRRLKGPDRPLASQSERAALLAALSCVDAVTVFDEDTPLETLQLVRPQVLVKGQDYRLEDVVGRDLIEREGGRVVLVPLVPEKSTSALVKRIRLAP